MTCSLSTVLPWPVKSENDSGRRAASAGLTGEESAEVMKPRPLFWSLAAMVYFHSNSAPRDRKFSTNRGCARLMISALRTTLLPGIAAATIVRATAARIT